jgi:T-complex protein 1 subunit delta
VIKKLGGTVEDTKLVDGLVFTQKSSNVNGPRKIEKAKIGLIQFCISPPKTDVSNLPLILFIYKYLNTVLHNTKY